MKIKTIRGIKNLKGKKVLLRADFDVPIEQGKIKDTFRIDKQVPTIKYLIERGARVIIVSYLGRPDPNRREKKYSLRPIADKLSNILNIPIEFSSESIGLKTGSLAAKLKEGEVLVLENIRYQSGEWENNTNFAKELASLGDIYVNNAFAVSHRAHASVAAIKKFIPSYAGLLLEEEVINLNKVTRSQKSLVVVLGGAKLDTKVKLIKKYIPRAKHILVGGALANNFLAAEGVEIGKSLADKENIQIAKNLLKYSRFLDKNNIVLPLDVIVSKKEKNWQAQVKNLKKVERNDYIFDIGPSTIRFFAKLIREGKTIIWNGPMGMFENQSFKHGTLSVGRVVASRSRGQAFGVVGGGETVEALQLTKMLEYVDWVSTGGGAMLSYLGGKKMPGLTGLIKK